MNSRIYLSMIMFTYLALLDAAMHASELALDNIAENQEDNLAENQEDNLAENQETNKSIKKDNKKSDKKDKDNSEKQLDNADNNKDKDNPDAVVLLKKLPLICSLGASELRSWIKLRIPEFFYGKNLRLINNDNPTDRILYFRHVLDLNTEYRFFNKAAGYDIIFAKVNIRSKGIWGDPESIAYTTSSDIKFLDSVIGKHAHGIPRHIFWIRELWMQMALNDFLHIPFCNYHTLTFGLFPFELGRGIALGASFTVDPTDLGFYAEASVDQYAPGAKLSGILSKDCLLYDIYAAILDNKAGSFSYTNENIRGQQFGHRNDQARGFGVITYLVAGRLKWIPCSRPNFNMHFEPYAFYYHNPEQRIEFKGDATMDLITLGIAGEAVIGNFEWGFDTAFNLGSQKVKGWDTNIIKPDSRDGFVVEVNSKVKQVPPGEPVPDCLANPSACKKIPLALYITENQDIIEISEQSAGENCKIIGTNEFGTLINDCTRFVNPYNNKLRGSMFVFDMGYFIRKPGFKLNAAFGYASGDANPNRDLDKLGDSQMDGDYLGFIGIQETYTGTRVQSAFLLSGSGKIPRLLSFPTKNAKDPFPSITSRFTNIVFTGTSIDWRPAWRIQNVIINPNLLFYWQENPTRIFNRKLNERSESQYADKFLGIELNAFVEAEIISGLRLFGVGSVFFPGKHYTDIKGLPITKAQQTFFDNKDKTGIVNSRVPLLGDDTAYFANVGLEYKF